MSVWQLHYPSAFLSAAETGILLFLCVLSTVEVACTAATGEVSLSADALSTPGGYVVPAGGNITFRCSSTSSDIILLFWRVNLTEMNNIENLVTTVTLNGIAGFNSSDTAGANPASFTFHNISFDNSPSVVECTDLSLDPNGASRATIIVEGSPNCLSVNTTVTTSSLTVSIQSSQMTWLPEWYCVQVITYSYNGSVASMAYNSTLKDTASFEVTPIQSDTVYNISVIPCNMAGCNESCDVHLVQTESETSIIGVPTATGETLQVVTIQPLTFIGVAILVFMVLLILVAIALASAGLFIRRKRGKWTPAKGTAEQRSIKPQSTQPEYAETAIDHNGTSNTEYAMVAHSNTSAKGHLAQGPSRQANNTCASGPGNSLEYATVHDALHMTENGPRSQASLTNIPSLPLSSPPAPPGSPAGVSISPDCVQDAGYASLPDSRSGSKRITKVRSIRQK